MASSITGTMAIRMSNWSKETLEGASRDGGCKMRVVMEDLARLVESGVIRITQEGLMVGDGRKTPENKKGPSANTKESELSSRIMELESEIAKKDTLLSEYENSHRESFPEWDISVETMSDIEQMAKLTGGTLEGFMNDLREKLNSGALELSGGRIVCRAIEEDVDLSGLREYAEFNRKTVQEVIDKAVQIAWRSRL